MSHWENWQVGWIVFQTQSHRVSSSSVPYALRVYEGDLHARICKYTELHSSPCLPSAFASREPLCWVAARLPSAQGNSRRSISVGITSRADSLWGVREPVSSQTEGCLLTHAQGET